MDVYPVTRYIHFFSEQGYTMRIWIGRLALAMLAGCSLPASLVPGEPNISKTSAKTPKDYAACVLPLWQTGCRQDLADFDIQWLSHHRAQRDHGRRDSRYRQVQGRQPGFVVSGAAVGQVRIVAQIGARLPLRAFRVQKKQKPYQRFLLFFRLSECASRAMTKTHGPMIFNGYRHRQPRC